MALVVKDRVKVYSSTTGTGTLSLGSAFAGFQTFNNALGDGDTTYYGIFESSTGNWEVGLGTYTSSGNTLSRDTILESSNAGAAVNLTADTEVFITYPAEKSVYFDASGDVNLTRDPQSALQAATKQYVDTIAAAGLHYHAPVRVEHPSNLTATYDNGTSGVGATLTNSGTQAVLVLDNVTMVVSDRVLIANQTNQAHNGVYTVTNVGSASTNWVLTRATDADSYGPSDPDALGEGDAFFIKEGDTNAGHLDVMTTSGTITFGTTNIVFSEVAETTVYSAGNGLSLSGTEFNVGAGTGITVNATTVSTVQDIATSATPTFDGLNTTGDITFGDNDKAIFGAGSDLQIYHDASASYIDDQGEGPLKIKATDFRIKNAADTKNYLRADDGGAVSIYYDNALKLATTSTGIDVTGNATFADNGKAIFGAGSDLQIYHDGSDSIIADEGTGRLLIDGSTQVIIRGGTNSEWMFRGVEDGASELYYNNSKKLATTSTGIDVTGNVTADGALSGSTSGYNFISGGNATNNGSNIFVYGSTHASEANNTLFRNGSSETMRIDSSGNVGIGTDAPASKLEVVSSSSGGAPVFSTSGTDHLSAIIGTAGGGFSTVTGNYFSIWHQPYADRGTQNNLTERMRIDSSGNVGINNTAPSALLEVGNANDFTLGGTSGDSLESLRLTYDTANADRLVFSTERTSTGTTWAEAAHRIQRLVDVTNMGYMQFGHHNSDLITFGENTTEYVRIDGDGNLTLGLGSSGSQSLIFEDSNNLDAGERHRIEFRNNSTARYAYIGAVYNSSGGGNGTALAFATNASGSGPAEAMRIDTSGRVIIGATTASYPFTVQSSGTSTVHIKTTGVNGYAQIRLENDAKAYSIGVGASDQLYLYDANSSANRILITSSGNVGIGADSPATTLHVKSSGFGDLYQLMLDDGSGNAGLEIGTYGSVGQISGSTGLDFEINKSLAMRITSDGEVAINKTTVPNDSGGNYKTLLVSNEATSKSGRFLAMGAASAYTSYAALTSGTHNGTTFYSPAILYTDTLRFFSAPLDNEPDDTNLTEQMRLTTTGLGIGTSSPASKLNVYSGTDPAIIAASDDWGEQLEIHRANSSVNWPSIKFTNSSGELGRVFVDASNDYLMYVKAGGSNYETVWTNYTDGSGSGLDADLLDGQQGSYYLDTSSTAQTKTGLLTVSDLDVTGSEINGRKMWATQSATVPAAGWYRVATSYSAAGRGDAYIHVYTTGSSYTPYSLFIKAHFNWSSTGRLYEVNNPQGGFWSDVRLTSDGTNTYVEVYFTGAIASNQLSIWSQSIGYDRFTPNSGTLASGGGTVQDSITLTGRKNFKGTVYGDGDLEITGQLDLEGPDGGLRLGTWTGGSTYAGLSTGNMANQEYVIITSGTSTFVSSGVGGTTNIRGPNNDGNIEITLDNSTVAVTGAMTTSANLTVGGDLIATDVDVSGTVQIGAEVILQESTDRADLLQITSTTSGWGGLQIRNSSNEGRWSFMTNGANAGIYDDENEKWHVYLTELGSTQLRYNGTSKFETTSGGVAVTGALTATGDITAYFSDERLKDFDGKIEGALDKVSQLNGYYYRENDKAKELGFENDALQVGVSAQEVEAVLPEVVKPAPVDPEYKTVQYEKLVPLLIEAIKELKEEVRQLKEDKA